jgi:hypothetical protein
MAVWLMAKLSMGGCMAAGVAGGCISMASA